MPAAQNEILVPGADLAAFQQTSAALMRTRLNTLGIAFTRQDRKYELYYRVAASGNRLAIMPAGYIPAIPPLPPGWPVPAPAGPAAPPLPSAPVAAPAPRVLVGQAALIAGGRLAQVAVDDRAARRARINANKARLAARMGAGVINCRPFVAPPQAPLLPAPALALSAIQNVANIAPASPPQPVLTLTGVQNVANFAPVLPSKPWFNNLIEVEATETVVFNGVAGATLQVRLEVYRLNRPSFRTLMGYYCHINLCEAGARDFLNIGNISAWGFSRRTQQHPNLDDSLWRSEFLEGSKLDEIKYCNDTVCIPNCLRAIYSRGGNVWPRITGPPGSQCRQNLANDGNGHALIYIAQLFVKHRSEDNTTTYAGNGFASRALQMFYRLLQGGVMPSYYGINGPATYILEPGFINDPTIGRVWLESQKRAEGETDVQLNDRVEAELTTFYTTGSRAFEIYGGIGIKGVGGSNGFKTLGRFVDAGIFPRQPTDRVLDTWREARGSARPAKSKKSPRPRRGPPTAMQDDSVVPVTPSRPGLRPRRPLTRRSSIGVLLASPGSPGDEPVLRAL